MEKCIEVLDHLDHPTAPLLCFFHVLLVLVPSRILDDIGFALVGFTGFSYFCLGKKCCKMTSAGS